MFVGTFDDDLTCLCTILNFVIRLVESAMHLGLLYVKSFLLVYNGCVSSLMSYGVEVWGKSAFATRAFLEQKRAVNIIKGLHILSSCRRIFKELHKIKS